MCARDTAHFLTSPKIPDAKGIFVMIQFTPVGDSGVLAVCGSEISEQVNAQVMALDAAVPHGGKLDHVSPTPGSCAACGTLCPRSAAPRPGGWWRCRCVTAEITAPTWPLWHSTPG